MSKLTMSFYFPEFRQDFDENLNLSDTHSLTLSARIDQIVEARRALLAPNVSILKLKATGQPKRDVDMKGTAAGYASLTNRLNLYCLNDVGLAIARMYLRGFPIEMIVHFTHLGQPGTDALAGYGKALNENGAFAVYRNEIHPIRSLTMNSFTQPAKSHRPNNGRPKSPAKLKSKFGKRDRRNRTDES